MAKPWSAVSASSEFKALPPEQQDGARRQYFDEVVAPQVPEGDRDLAWGQFSTDTGMGRRELPAGVAPSAAGGGRGSVNPLPDEAANPVLQRNKQYAKPAPAAGGYRTTLSQAEESEFGDWVRKNRIPNDDSATSDYDMRGYFRAMKSGVAGGPSINANDGMPHFPDTFKTPYHKSFSNESRYANADAPRWNEQDQLVDKAGRVIFDERKEGQPVPALSNDKSMLVADVTPAASGDASGAGDGAAIMDSAQPQRSSVLEGMQMPERPFDPAEGARLSNRAVAEATPMPGSPRRAQPEMRASTGPQPTTINTERGQALQDASLPVRAAFKAVSGAAQGAGGVIRSVGDATGIGALQRAGAETTKGASEFEAGMGDQGPVEGFGPKSPVPYLSNMAEGAASSLAQSAAYASMFGAKAVIPLMSVMTAGQEYDKARTAGLSPAAALAGAIPKGAFEAIGEKFTGLDKVAGAMGTLLTRGATAQAKEEAAKTLIHSGIKEIPGEVITYLGQTGVDLLPGIGLNPDLTMGQFVDGLRDTVVQAGMMGGAMGAGGAAIRTDPRIKRLRDAGETGAADLLQSQLDKQNTAASVDNELTGIAPLADFAKSPEFQADYRAMRTEGIKPVEAAGRSALTSTFRGLASTAGMPEKAVNAAMDAAKKVGLDKLPGFLQRFTASLAAKGVIQPGEGLDTIGASLEQNRDHAMNAAIGATLPPEDVRKTMDSVKALEQAKDVPAAPEATTAAGTPEAGIAPADVPLDTGNDVRVTPETDQVHTAATSPLNDLPEPTQAQKEAGNYKVGRLRIAGMDIAVENPQGSTRRGVSAEGKPWESPMRHHYGYFNGTLAADGDKLDVFVEPGTPENYTGPVYVVDQIDPKTGKLDEHKVLIGPRTEEEARAMYQSNYDAGWKGLGAITRLPLPAFKAWAKSGTLKEPLGDLTANTPASQTSQTTTQTAANQAPAPAGSDAQGPAAAGTTARDATLQTDGVDAPIYEVRPNGSGQYMVGARSNGGKRMGQMGVTVKEVGGKKYLSIDDVMVRDEHQGKGVGTGLYSHLLDNLPEGIDGVLSEGSWVKNKQQVPAVHKKLAQSYEVSQIEGGVVFSPRKKAHAFPSEARADGTLAVKGDAAAIREALSTIPAKSLMAMKGGILVGRTQADKATAILHGETPKMTAREAAEAGQAAREAEKKAKAAAARAKPASEGLTVGIMPGNAEPVTVRDGVVYIGKYAAQNFDTGEDVTVPAGATDQQIVDALKSGGALAQKQRVFGLAKSDSEGLTAPTKEDVLAQQQRKEDGAKAEAKAKTATENKAKADAERNEFALTGSDRAADVGAAGGQDSMFARDDAQPSRSHPRSTITFAQPISGPSGKKLTAYTWQWKPVEFIDARGEERVARISDWEKSERNAETGRDVVHQFIVDGQSVSLETAARMLGYESANAGPLKTTASAVKTVARLRMQLAEVQQALDAYNTDKAKVDAMTPPAITGPNEKGWYNMGETQVRQIEPGALREERRRALTDHWRSDKLAEKGWRGGTIEGESLRRQHEDLTDRAERAVRKVGIAKDDAPALARKGFDADAFSRMFRPPTAMAVTDVQKAVDQLAKGWKSGPTIKVVATPADLPITAPADARGLIHNGTAYVVARNHINRDGVARTLGHEAVGHYGLWRMLGEDGQARFERNLQLAMRSGNTQLVFGAGTGKLVKLSDKVRANYLDKDGNYTLTPAEESSEIAAFAVENAVDPATGQFKPGFGFVKEVYAKVAEFLRSLGIYVKFTNVELQGMLMAAMRGLKAGHKLEGGGQVMVAAARDGAADVGNVLLELGRQDGLFQMPRSESRDLTEIAQAKGLKVAPVDRNSTDNKLWMLANTTPADAPGVQSWIVTLPNGKHGTLTNDKGKVYINVSSVGEGNRGNAIYDLAANYAATNGLQFIGDPNGVSPAAMRRRLENMLSSAVKYGTTDHLAPHPDQLEGNKAIGVPPLQWTEGDTVGNINAMVAASTAATEASNPVSTSNVHFDAATQSFRDGENHRLDDASLSAMLGFDGRESGTGSAGRATLQRNALFRALLQSEGARRAFLEQLRDERRGGGSGTGGGLKGSFYARGDAAPRVDQTAAQSRGKNEAVTAFNNASGDFNPELDAFWLKKGRQEINGDGMPDDEYHQAVAEYANSWRLDKLLEEQGWVRRGSSNVSSSTYFTKYIEDPASGDEKKYEIRVSDHDDRHPADFDIEQRFQVNFRDGTAQWSDADLGPELSSAEITDRLKDILPNESTAPDSGGATAFARGTGNLFQPNIWSTPDPTRTDRVIYELQDGKVDLKRVQEAITKSGQQITEQYDARLAETLYPGRVAYRSKSFLDTEAKPLLEAMARNKVEMDELADYLHARGAKERNAQIAKVNPNMPDGGAGTNSKGVLLTNQAAQDYLANVKPARKVVLDAMAKRVDAITAGTRNLLVTEGLEKQDTIDAWEAAYKNYVPMFRDEAETGFPPHPQGSGFAVKGSASKRATGSTKEVTNILAHVLMQREAAITRAEKNRVALALYGQALSHPNPDFWTTIRPGMDAAAIGAELQSMGVDPMTAEVGMKGVPTIRTVSSLTGKVVDAPNPMYRNLPGAIPLKVNGEDRVLMLNVEGERGRRLAESLKNLDGLTQLDLAGSIVGQSTRWLAAVNTQYNPAFGLVNLTRDVLEGALNVGSTELRGNSTRVLAQVPLAIQGIARELSADGKGGSWGKLYKQFVADGGQTGFKENFRDPNERARAVEKELQRMHSAGKLTAGNAAHAALDLLDGFNTTLENAVRLSAYKVALDKGISRAKAARLARELTVDFNRKGRAGREIGPLYAFFNASVQGAERALRTLKGPTGRRILAGGLALGVIQAMMLAAAGYDDDEIPEFVKTRAFVIPLNWSGKGEKTHILIPLPLGFLMVPNTGRVLTELTLNGGKDMGKRIFEAIGTIAGSFNPLGGGNIFTMDGALKTVAPTLIDPLIEIGFNKNFAGGQIEKQGYGSETDGRPGVARTKESTQRSTTGQVYMGISKAINTLAGGNDYQGGVVSPTPERVRYLAQTVGGGVLREIEKTINASTATARGEKVKSSQIPVAGRFYGEVDDDQVQMSRYFEGAKKLKTLESSLKAAKQAGDVTAMLKMIETHPEIAFIKAQAKVQSEISGLNKLAVSTVKDPETIKVIDKARVEKMKALNGAIEELEKANGKVTLGDRLKSSVKPHMAEAKP